MGLGKFVSRSEHSQATLDLRAKLRKKPTTGLRKIVQDGKPADQVGMAKEVLWERGKLSK